MAQVIFTLKALGEETSRELTYGTITIDDRLLDTSGLALHKAIKWEVESLARDIRPYLVEAVYQELIMAQRRAEADAQ